MSITPYLTKQLHRHPSMRPQDVIKLCYQAARGAEHLLADPERARRYLEAEFASVAAAEGELYEPISDKVCRVNLAVWKARGLPIDRLFRLFVDSCKITPDADAIFAAYLAEADALIGRVNTAFSHSDWEDFLAAYRQAGMPALHHSEAYRMAEHPAYRIVRRELCGEITAL